MNTVYRVKVQGNVIETTVTSKGSVVDEWIRSVQPTAYCFQNIVGLERQSCYLDNYSSDPAGTNVLQVCVGTKCLLYQPLDFKTDTPRLVQSFFSDYGFIFVGVNVKEKMRGAGPAFSPVTSIDIEELAVERWCWPKQGVYWKPGLKVLAKSVANLDINEMPQHVSSSILQSRQLSTFEQIEYACIHCYASFRIGYELLKHGPALPNMMKSAAADDDDEE